MDSNEKAKLTAALGLCLVEVSPEGKVMGGICPAQGGQMAHVKIKRYPNSIQITSCRHHQFNGGQHWCEGWGQGHVCYHAKAILTQSADQNGFDVEFDIKPSEGCTAIYSNPSKLLYMKAIMRRVPVLQPAPDEPAPVEHVPEPTKTKKKRKTAKV